MNSPPIQPFNFPPEKADEIEARLRAGINPQNRDEPLKSVRPEREELRQRQREAAPGHKVIRPEPVDGGTTQVLMQKAQLGTKATVPVIEPPITPIDTAEYLSFALPSRGYWYDWKDLYIKPFRVPHLAKLAKARDNDSLQLVAEAVGSVLRLPDGRTNFVYDMSMTDFNAVLYWLRLSSFEKPTMRVKAQCVNEKHHLAVHEGLIAEETLTVDFVVAQSELVTKYLDNAPDPKVYSIVAGGWDIPMRPTTVMDSIEFMDDPRFGDDEFSYSARVASVLDMKQAMWLGEEEAPPPRRWSMAERVDFVNNYFSPDQALLCLEFETITDDAFGVVETVDYKCHGCSASGKVKLSIDARSFLSPRF